MKLLDTDDPKTMMCGAARERSGKSPGQQIDLEA
jgi:hypothetical protein